VRRRVIARPGHNKVGDRTARAGAWTARAIEGPARPHPLPQCSAKKVTGRHPSCRGGDGATVGEPSGRLCGRTRGELHRTDARTQTEAAPDEQTEMRCRPANQSLITDVLRSVPSSARSIESYRHSRPGRGVDKLHRSWLTWDIRTYKRAVASGRLREAEADAATKVRACRHAPSAAGASSRAAGRSPAARRGRGSATRSGRRKS